MAVLSLVIDIAESLSSWILKARELLILAVLKPIHHKPMGFNSLLHSTELTIIWNKFLWCLVVIFVVSRTWWLDIFAVFAKKKKKKPPSGPD
jgi:hypothetical protein